MSTPSCAWNRDVWSNFMYQKIIILFMKKRASSCLLPSKATLHLLLLMQLDIFFHRMSASPFKSHVPSYSFSRNTSWLAPFNSHHWILGCLQGGSFCTLYLCFTYVGWSLLFLVSNPCGSITFPIRIKSILLWLPSYLKKLLGDDFFF